MHTQYYISLAEKAFGRDNNCAQALLLAFSEKLNFKSDDCLRVASGFGGGIAMSGGICGAVSGGIMVLGLAGSGEGDSKTKTYEDSKLLISRFEKKFGTCTCKLLTESKTEFDTKSFCNKFVREATIVVAEILEKE